MDKFNQNDKVTFINHFHQRVNCKIVGKHPDFDKNRCYIITTDITDYHEFIHESRIQKVSDQIS